MNEVVVVAKIGIAPGKRDEALAALERLCEETHGKDEGCQLYALQLDPADDSQVYMIEKWDSSEALDKHIAADHIQAFGASGTTVGGPEVTILQQANFGDASRGSL
jgi:quinol monooxygenase YgiN